MEETGYDITFEKWLSLEPLDHEILGDPHTGYYVSLEAIRKKIAYMELKYEVTINYYNFRHLLFNSMDKQTYSSGTIELEIIRDGKVFKRLVGASTHNSVEYDNNTFFANTSKTLAIRNALLEYPTFGANLNKQELILTISGKRFDGKTSSAVKDFQKQL